MPRRGVIVSEINVSAQLRLLEVRRELERLLACSTTQRATQEQRQQFLKIAAAMDQAARQSDDIAFMRLDRALNRLLLEAAGNEFGAAALGLLNGLSRRFWFAHHRRGADLPKTARLHAAVARALAENDPEAAGAASDKLMDYIGQFTRRMVG